MGMVHACAACGYSAEVSGGPDRGRWATVQTVACATCRTLQAAPTRIYIERGGRPGPPRGRLVPPACAVDPSHPITPWTYPAPCPRCAGEMAVVPGPSHFWD